MNPQYSARWFSKGLIPSLSPSASRSIYHYPIPYLCPDQSQVGVALADDAEQQIVNRFRHHVPVVRGQEDGLELVSFFEYLVSEINILIAHIGQHGRLRVNVLVFPCFRDDAAFDVAETKRG